VGVARARRRLLWPVLLVILDVGIEGIDPENVMSDGRKIPLDGYFLRLGVIRVIKLADRRKGGGGRERLGMVSRGRLVAIDWEVLALIKRVVDLTNLVAQHAEALVVLAGHAEHRQLRVSKDNVGQRWARLL